MRIYISGGITGVENYREAFRKAHEKLTKGGHDVINPALYADSLPWFSHEEYIELGLHFLSICDAIYMLKGWQKSCGANREYGYALATDKIIVLED
jgi:hypothetical protein